MKGPLKQTATAFPKSNAIFEPEASARIVYSTQVASRVQFEVLVVFVCIRT